MPVSSPTSDSRAPSLQGEGSASHARQATPSFFNVAHPGFSTLHAASPALLARVTLGVAWRARLDSATLVTHLHSIGSSDGRCVQRAGT